MARGRLGALFRRAPLSPFRGPQFSPRLVWTYPDDTRPLAAARPIQSFHIGGWGSTALAPHDGECWHKVGTVLFEQGLMQGAVTCFRAAGALRNDSLSWLSAAHTLHKLQKVHISICISMLFAPLYPCCLLRSHSSAPTRHTHDAGVPSLRFLFVFSSVSPRNRQIPNCKGVSLGRAGMFWRFAR